MKNYIFLTLAWTLVPNKPYWKMAQMEISLSSKYFPYFSSFNNYSNALYEYDTYNMSHII